jgi:glycosyltransferase involved in cell wall biosynthesis
VSIEPHNLLNRNQLLLTVIIVTKNPGVDIYPTLASLKCLDDPGTEILIKDNSSDRSIESVNEMFAFQNLRYIHSGDEGIYDAMNQALSEAKGEFIYFLNAGDQHVDCNLLQVLRNANKEIGFFYGDVISLKPYIRKIRYTYYINKYILYLKRICHQGFIFRNRIFKSSEPFDTRLKAEADFLFSLKMVDNFIGKKLDCFLTLYQGGGLSYKYEPDPSEKEIKDLELRKIFNTIELSLLKLASIFVTSIVYIKNIKRRK